MKSVQSSVASNQLEGKRPLPEGWVWTTVGQVTLPVEKVSPEQKPDVPFVYIDISSIDNSIQKIVEPKEYLGSEAPSRARQLIRANDVVFATVRTYLKNVALVPEIYDKQIASTGFSILRASDAVQSKFLFYFTLTDEFLSPLNELQRGTSYPAVRDGDVRVQPFPLPPLPEQERIVARLEELLSDLEAGVAALERVRRGVKRYKASVLKAACEGKLFESRRAESSESGLPEGWRLLMFEELLPNGLANGLYKPSETLTEEGTRMLDIKGLYKGFDVDFGNCRRFILTENERRKYALHEGDVLVNRVSKAAEGVGKSALVRRVDELTVFESNMMLARLSDECYPPYINYFLNSLSGRSQTLAKAKTTQQSSVNQDDIKSIVITLPPLEEQRRIVAAVERRLESARAVESAVEAGLKRAARLRQAVLRSAFKGRL